jgi:type II secretory pathway predicted ATPase ExeA
MDEVSRTRRLSNPFRPGAGHAPPYLAGRESEKVEFKRLLEQDVILSNQIVTGLRGVGKTVLVEEFKPIAYREKWLWVGTDLSESASVAEDTVARRLLADLSAISSGISVSAKATEILPAELSSDAKLDYRMLMQMYESQAGLAADKLKNVLGFVWGNMSASGARGVVFAYDEAQTMSDHHESHEFPLSLLLDVFQSIQRREIRFLLVLAGLPTLLPKLISARTYAERMFKVMTLTRLSPTDSKAAIILPIKKVGDCPVSFSEKAIANIIEASDGYPYFIQFICKEAFDIYAQQWAIGAKLSVSLMSIITKLDKAFFAGRWAIVTDRQKDLLRIIARLKNSGEEFSVQDIVAESRVAMRPFSASHVNQMLITLGDAGLIYKNRHGRYAFAVPLLGEFIRRQEAEIDGKQLNLPIGDSFE